MTIIDSRNGAAEQAGKSDLPPSMVERMTRILDAFDSRATRLSLEEVARRAELPRSTVYRILHQLTQSSWIEHTSFGYALGRRALGLGGGDGNDRIRAAAAPLLHELHLRTGMVVHLTVLDGGDSRYLDKVGGRFATQLPSRVGGCAPAYSTAGGKAILAGLEPEAVDRLYRTSLVRRTGRTISERATLHHELSRIRLRGGLAFDESESVSGVACVGVAVRGHSGPIAAVSLCGDARSVRFDHVAPLVVNISREVSRTLFPGPPDQQSGDAEIRRLQAVGTRGARGPRAAAVSLWRSGSPENQVSLIGRRCVLRAIRLAASARRPGDRRPRTRGDPANPWRRAPRAPRVIEQEVVVMGQVLDRIEQYAEEIRAEGVAGDELMRLSDTSAGRLRSSGAIRMLQPKAHGGFECHPREFAETTMAIAAMDGAAGWVTGIVGVHPWELAFADPRVQEEIWGADQDTWVASPYAPMGVAIPVDGGYLLNGRWSFSSGTDHCQWAFLGALAGDTDGKPVMPPNSLHVILPRSDYEIVADSWDVIGLRGTGSKDLIVENAFVPEYRTLSAAEVMDGTAVRRAGRTETLYRMPFSCMFPLGITSAVIGIAEGALACHIAAQRERVAVTGIPIKDDPYVLFSIGEAAAEIAASRAALLENVDRFWDSTEKGREVSFEERAIGRRTQTAAAWRAVRAVDEIFARAGGGALHYRSPMQRFFRDAHAGLAHAIHVPGSIFHASALTQLGGEPQGIHRSMI